MPALNLEMSGFSLVLESKSLRREKYFQIFYRRIPDIRGAFTGFRPYPELGAIESKTIFHSLVHLAQHHVEGLQFGEQLAFVGPNVQFLYELRHDEESSPAADFLRFQNVAENVIADIQDVLALGADQFRENVART